MVRKSPGVRMHYPEEGQPRAPWVEDVRTTLAEMKMERIPQYWNESMGMTHEDAYRYGVCDCETCTAKRWLDEMALGMVNATRHWWAEEEKYEDMVTDLEIPRFEI